MTRRHPIIRIIKWIGFILTALVIAVLVNGWRQFGHRATGIRRARMERSPQWSGGHFVNPQPLVNHTIAALMAVKEMSADARPNAPVPTSFVNPRMFDTVPPTGLRVTWFGHSTTLVEIDGHRVLTDPIWSERASPFTWIGPTRYYAPLIAITDLPPLDAVVISHDHYDHLDYKTIVALIKTHAIFVVPLGVGAHLEYWGVPLNRIVELDWWEHAQLGDLAITATPARHASGRALWDKDATLWAGYAITGVAHRVFYSGDTGLFPALNEIGNKLGPFDLAMIEVGQYNKSWPDWHSGPEQAVNASIRVRAKAMLPVHWGLFTLAMHAWTEPEERALAESTRLGMHLFTPTPGENFEPTIVFGEAHQTRWWPNVKWHSGAQDPIVSTRVH